MSDNKLEYEDFNGEIVTAIDCSKDESSIEAEHLYFEYVRFWCDDKHLEFTVNNDTDEIILTMRWNHFVLRESAEAASELEHLVGRKLGWCWLAHNYLGYQDIALISFSGLEPQLALVGEGSYIKLFWLTAMRKI